MKGMGDSMNGKRGLKILSLFTILMMLAGGLAVMMATPDASADEEENTAINYTITHLTYSISITFNVYVGQTIDIFSSGYFPDKKYYGLSRDAPEIPGTTYSEVYSGVLELHGTATEPGTYTMRTQSAPYSEEDAAGVITIKITERTDEYTVTYDGNGGYPDWESDTDSSVTLPSAWRSGYIFLGWTTTKDSESTKVGTAGDTYFPLKNITLYALWRSDSEGYIVTFDGNGGTPEVKTKVGTWMELPSATRSGYVFRGWSTDYTETNVVGMTGDYYYPDTDITLHAIWLKKVGYEVRFEGNGGTAYESWLMGKTVELPRAYRGGYDFVGWSTVPDGSNIVGTTGDTYTPTKDITLYATWQQRTSGITVDFFIQGEGRVSPDSITGIPNNAVVTVRDNRITIDGRSVTATANEGYSFYAFGNIETGERLTENKTITVLFVKTEGYSIHFLTNKGGLLDSNPELEDGLLANIPYNTDVVVGDNQIAVYGTVVTAIAGSGYTFKGWSIESQKLTQNIEVVALFESDNPPVPPGPEPEPEQPSNVTYLYIAVGTGAGAVALIGAAIAGIRHPVVYVVSGVLVVVAVAMATMYFGIIKL